MTRMLTFVAALLLVQFVPATVARAISGPDLPSPLDEQSSLIERYWSWLKDELNAPLHVPWPEISVEPLPRSVDMAFVFPTEEAPSNEMRIVVSPGAIARAAGPKRLEVVGELAHELAHYAMLLSENDWDLDAKAFRNEIHHHCDREFMRLTRQIGVFIWDTYHSNDAVRYVRDMVQLACWRDGHTISNGWLH